MAPLKSKYIHLPPHIHHIRYTHHEGSPLKAHCTTSSATLHLIEQVICVSKVAVQSVPSSVGHPGRVSFTSGVVLQMSLRSLLMSLKKLAKVFFVEAFNATSRSCFQDLRGLPDHLAGAFFRVRPHGTVSACFGILSSLWLLRQKR